MCEKHFDRVTSFITFYISNIYRRGDSHPPPLPLHPQIINLFRIIDFYPNVYKMIY